MYKHYYSFDKRLTKEMKNKNAGRNEIDWDVLRNDETEGQFSIENSVESYELNCKKSTKYHDIAKIIIDLLKE